MVGSPNIIKNYGTLYKEKISQSELSLNVTSAIIGLLVTQIYRLFSK